MWAIPDLVQEIESIGRMLQVRLKAFTAGSKKAEEFEKGMLHTLCSKINGLNVLSIMDAQQLYQAISSSDLNEGQQSAISECIDAKLTEEKETQLQRGWSFWEWRAFMSKHANGQLLFC